MYVAENKGAYQKCAFAFRKCISRFSCDLVLFIDFELNECLSMSVRLVWFFISAMSCIFPIHNIYSICSKQLC